MKRKWENHKINHFDDNYLKISIFKNKKSVNPEKEKKYVTQ